MIKKGDIDVFLANFNDELEAHALQLRNQPLTKFPGIIEQLDIPARMIGSTYS